MSGVDSSSRSTKVKKLPTTRMSTTVITKYYNPLWGMTDEVMNGWAFTRAIQQSALYNFYSKQTINFIENNNTFTVDTKTQNPPNLQMEPAMSYIWSLPFVVISEDIESGEELFTEIFTVEDGWVRTSLDKGRDIICEIESSDM